MACSSLLGKFLSVAIGTTLYTFPYGVYMRNALMVSVTTAISELFAVEIYEMSVYQMDDNCDV